MFELLPYPRTSITMTIMTQTMIPARKRSRTMKSRLVSIAITKPLQRGRNREAVSGGFREKQMY